MVLIKDNWNVWNILNVSLDNQKTYVGVQHGMTVQLSETYRHKTSKNVWYAYNLLIHKIINVILVSCILKK